MAKVLVETLIEAYRKGREIDYQKLGIITDQKIILSQVLFQKTKITKTPYVLMADRNTFNEERKKLIEYIVEDIVIKNHDKGNSNRTISSAISKCINFINWCNIENISFFNNIKTATKAFILYTDYLKESIRLGKYSQGEAHSKHMASYKLLNTIFNDDKNIIGSGIKIIQNKRNNKVVKSSEENQKYHFNFYHAFFNQITDFLLENKKYPFLLELQNKQVWCLPSISCFIHSEKQSPMPFNMINGEIHKELLMLIKKRLMK